MYTWWYKDLELSIIIEEGISQYLVKRKKEWVNMFFFVVKGISQYVLGCRIKLLKREYCVLVYTLYEREGLACFL